MTVELKLEWAVSPPDAELIVTGDVRPVIHSRASRTTRMPVVTHGFGALALRGLDEAGEGMAWQGTTGATPPKEVPDVVTGPQDQFSTPFFVGWNGAPAAQGSFSSDGITLLELYEHLFETIPAQYPLDSTSIILLEITGMARAGHIHDRALKKPVHEGDRLITALASEYFNFRIIQEDLKQRGISPDQSLELAIVGAGYRKGVESPSLHRFEEIVFYEPPRIGDSPDVESVSGSPKIKSEERKIKTHSHMMGWREAGSHQQTRKRKPDYILHLDEWSRLSHGSLRVFIPSMAHIRFMDI